jgi:hypothetical protein
MNDDLSLRLAGYHLASRIDRLLLGGVHRKRGANTPAPFAA